MKMPTEEEVKRFGANDLTTPNELLWWRRGIMRGVFWGAILGFAIGNTVASIINQLAK